MHPVNPFLDEHDIAEGDTRALLELLHRFAKELADDLDLARRVQWTPASPPPHIDGQPANPTADITADPSRLRLRLQVIAAESVLRDAVRYLADLRVELARSMEPYGGLDP